MSADINFPIPCVLCAYHATDDQTIEPGRILSPGIGKVCGDCLLLVVAARNLLNDTPGINRHMIPDGDRNLKPTSKTKNPKS